MTRLKNEWRSAADLPNDRLRLTVEYNGEPVTGACVGTFASWCDLHEPSEGRRNGLTVSAGDRKRQIKTNAEGIVTIIQKHLFRPKWPKDRNQSLIAIHAERKIGALVKVRPENLGMEIKLSLLPLCRVQGTLESTELTSLGKRLNWTKAYAWWRRMPPAASESNHNRIEMLLPPGSYWIDAYGGRTYFAGKSFRIRRGQKSATIHIDLPAQRLQFLLGKKAPALRKIKEWQNGKGVSLAKLKGKVVILDFWGSWCGPCVRSMPKLMSLHEKFAREGLEVVALHDDSVESIAKMYEKCADVKKDLWGGRDLPFHVAIDGGGECKVKGQDWTARGETTAHYGIDCFPTTLLIDRRGVLVGRCNIHNAKAVEKRVRRLLEQ